MTQLELTNKVVVAPMAGITDGPFRKIAWEHKPALMWTEMISAQALLYGNERTWRMARPQAGEGPLVIQIFGKDPLVMAKAAEQLAGLEPAAIDINMGCPAPKIVKNGEGAALSLQPKLAAQIMSAVSRAVNIPVLAKIRSGWDDEQINAVEMATLLEQSGAASIVVHGRTRAQFYSGQADLTVIGQVRAAVSLPVIGNGDIFSPLAAQNMLRTTGCDAVMLARGVLGNPWLIGQVIRHLASGEILPAPSLPERLLTALRHLNAAVADLGEHKAIPEMRKHLAWYIKGLPGAARVRAQIMELDEAVAVRALLLSSFGEAGIRED